ncbi:MAG: hypothetical protein EOP05_13115 [Proteobacteria bacterium]|nr:MAG: hypothetical protein EOP05_13115 [Pseudomonadota bacterium]
MTEAVEQVTYVTQSRFFTPAFNAAIFDGPIRIYFAQYQEAQALKLYFNLQERFGDVRKQARGIFKERGANIFVMIYPNNELFGETFDEAGASSKASGCTIIKSRLGADFIVGVRGPLEDGDLESLCREMDQIVSA